jgi:hypothetical protein
MARKEITQQGIKQFFQDDFGWLLQLELIFGFHKMWGIGF